MRAQTENVLQKLFSENSLDNIPLERLKQITEEHPYFTLGHFLLAKKLQAINAEEYETQSEKAAIYFNEPMWLQTLLHPATESDLVIRERVLEEEPETISEEIPAMHPVDEPVVTPVELENTVEIEALTSEVSEPQVVVQPTEEKKPSEETGNEEATSEEAPPIFEPYHTVDYFASQGIKVSNEIRPDDRLGQQLRSFTEWLKAMKRLPETKVEAQLDEVKQQNIQEFASHSLEQKEVVTETMAEVLIKQHKEEEALLIYEKLSLLNPSKRAYFAAKIEQLKGQ